MQVKYETQIIEPLVIKPDDFSQTSKGSSSSGNRTTLDSYTIEDRAQLNSISYLTCNPLNNVVAIYVARNQQIVLIDTKTYLKREKFPLKSCDKKFSKHSFTLKGLDFSPDGLKLAVGQSDCIIYIYKLSNQIIQSIGIGANQIDVSSTTSSSTSAPAGSGKPTISGKFLCSSPVTCLLWSDFGIIFGTQDGKVKLVVITQPQQQARSSLVSIDSQLTGNNVSVSQQVPTSNSSSSASSSKVINLYSSSKNSSPAMPISLAAKYPIVAVGFVDGTIQLINVNNNDIALGNNDINIDLGQSARRSSIQLNSSSQVGQTLKHSRPPYYITILQNNILCLAGSDGRIVFHSINITSNSTSFLQQVEIKEEILGLDYSNVNEILAIITSNRLMFIKHDIESNEWQLQANFIEVSQILSLASVRWLKDGTQLILGTLDGSLELFQCSWNKQASIGEQFDICHIAKNRVRITDRERNLLATYKTQHDIKRVNLLDNGQGVVIWTSSSILLASMSQPGLLQSEIAWNSREKSVKFSFKHLSYVLIINKNTRELHVVKLGQDSILYSVKFEQDLASSSNSTTSSKWPLQKSLICVQQYPSVIQQLGDSRISPVSVGHRIRSADKQSFPTEIQPSDNLDSSLEIQPQINGSKNKSKDEGSVFERLAFVGPDSNNQLTIIDLRTKTKQLQLKMDYPIERVEFSNSTNYLIYKLTNGELGLINMKGTNNITDPKLIMLKDCHFAEWLPNSDILVGQSKFNINIWYNMEDLTEVQTIDSRSCNMINSAPMVDLSLIKVGSTISNYKKRQQPYPTVKKVDRNGIHLTNKQTIALDKTKVKFYTKILEHRLDEALELLLDETNNKCPEKLRKSLLNKLGWIAINNNDCEVAIRVFTRLQYTSMVNCLERCLECEQPEEFQWRFAMIKGDWNLFEQIADLEHIIITYKRLNKWTRLINYLERKQQFRQRDLAEEEYQRWLIGKGRFSEAAEILLKGSDLCGALELLMNNSKYELALDIFIRELKSPLSNNSKLRTHLEERLVELARQLRDKFKEENKLDKAARVSERVLKESAEALDLYLKSNCFDEALSLARSNTDLFSDEKVAQIEESFAKYLIDQYESKKLSRKKLLPAINHLLAAKQYFEALSLSLKLKDYQRAYEILVQFESELMKKENEVDESCEKVREFCEEVGSQMLAKDLFEEAIKIYSMNDNYETALNILLNQGEYQRALDLASKHLYNNDRDKTFERFIELAKKLEEEKKYEKAEQILLIIGKLQMAIDLQRRAKNYDRMLELIEQQQQPDLLESQLLLLARQMEQEGRFSEAERYLLRASEAEWTNAVRMYRLANKWDEAFRVAKEHCSSPRDPLLIQLAFWWSKSMLSDSKNGVKEARKLLNELGLFNLVIEFCCDNKNYQFAIDLCDGIQSLESKRNEVISRFAASLEEIKKFKQAEDLLVKYDLIEEAVRMYIDNELFQEAVQIVDDILNGSKTIKKDDSSNTPSTNNDNKQKLVDLLDRTLIKCAQRILEKVPKPQTDQQRQQILRTTTNGISLSQATLDKLQRAQQLYLRAQRPDLAVELYQERGMWQEAIEVAQRFAPQLLEGVENALDAQVMSDVGPILAEVKANRQSSRSSSHSSRTSLSSGGIGNQLSDNLNNQQTSERSFKQLVSSNMIQSKAEKFMKNGDIKQTKLALSKFMDTLIDGQGHLVELHLVSLNNWLSELKKILNKPEVNKSTNNLEELRLVIGLCDRIIGQASWGQFRGWTDGQSLVWISMRDSLAAFFKVKRIQFVNETSGVGAGSVLSKEAENDHETRGELLDELARRLLISHYVVLHSALMGHLQSCLTNTGSASSSPSSSVINLDQAAAARHSSKRLARGQPGPSARNSLVANATFAPGALGSSSQQARELLWPTSLSVSLAERLRNQFAVSSRLQQQAVGQIVAVSGADANLIIIVVNLIGKLSLSLLRYSNILDAKRAFHVAGFWSLVANRPHLTRFAWTRLIELSGETLDNNKDNTKSVGPPAQSRVQFELERAGIPEVGDNFNGANIESADETNNQLTQSLINEIRQWLLEALIERAPLAGRKLSLDDRGQIEWSLVRPLKAECAGARRKGPRTLEPCLVTGYPVFENSFEQLILSSSGNSQNNQKQQPKENDIDQSAGQFHLIQLNQVRLSDWNNLLAFNNKLRDSTSTATSNTNSYSSNHSEQLQHSGYGSAASTSSGGLNHIIDFIVRLSGADLSATRITRPRQQQELTFNSNYHNNNNNNNNYYHNLN